ncbi:unnamed protein product [Cyclocybe aegerita]|uniref:Uncharacterized protein n=1 Tax=Cyclocybe aegerita TaxID=1973307 RepID=A0A8S0W5L7_CYCAE|nr:unnamed protein product [Cyclocybe aegerita]
MSLALSSESANRSQETEDALKSRKRIDALLKGYYVQRATEDFSKDTSARGVLSPETINELKQWIVKWVLSDDDESYIFWLYGEGDPEIALIGHSAMQELQRHREHFDTTATVVLSDEDSGEELLGSEQILPTIVYQLAIGLPSFRGFVLDAFDGDPTILSRSPDHQMDELLIKPFCKAAAKEPSMKKNVIFIAGVDDNTNIDEDDFLGSFLPRLHRLESALPRLKFIFVGTKNPSARHLYGIRQPVMRQISLHHGHHSTKVQRETDSFFERLVSDSLTSEQEIAKLATRAGGFSQYRIIVAGFYQRDQNKNVVKRSEKYLASNRTIQLNQKLAEQGTYFPPEDRHGLSYLLRTLLTILLLSGGDMPLSHLAKFLFMDARWLRTLLMRGLSPIIFHSPRQPVKDTYVRIAHPSLTDFLQDRTRSGKFYINSDDALPQLRPAFLLRGHLLSPDCFMQEVICYRKRCTNPTHQIKLRIDPPLTWSAASFVDLVITPSTPYHETGILFEEVVKFRIEDLLELQLAASESLAEQWEALWRGTMIWAVIPVFLMLLPKDREEKRRHSDALEMLISKEIRTYIDGESQGLKHLLVCALFETELRISALDDFGRLKEQIFHLEDSEVLIDRGSLCLGRIFQTKVQEPSPSVLLLKALKSAGSPQNRYFADTARECVKWLCEGSDRPPRPPLAEDEVEHARELCLALISRILPKTAPQDFLSQYLGTHPLPEFLGELSKGSRKAGKAVEKYLEVSALQQILAGLSTDVINLSISSKAETTTDSASSIGSSKKGEVARRTTPSTGEGPSTSVGVLGTSSEDVEGPTNEPGPPTNNLAAARLQHHYTDRSKLGKKKERSKSKPLPKEKTSEQFSKYIQYMHLPFIFRLIFTFRSLKKIKNKGEGNEGGKA